MEDDPNKINWQEALAKGEVRPDVLLMLVDGTCAII